MPEPMEEQKALAAKVQKETESTAQKELLKLLEEEHKRRLPPKKYWAAALTLLVLAGGGLGWWIYTEKGSSEDEVTYRQYTVQRGDVTVGISESSSISLDREVITFPVSTTVEKIFVKAGESVRKGDPLMRLNAEEIEAGMVSYRLQVQMAELELEQAKLDQQSKLVKAEQEYRATVLEGELAADNQSLSVSDLEKKLASAQEDLEDALENLDKYRNYEEDYDDDYSDLQALEKRVETYRSLYQDYQSQYDTVADLEIKIASYRERIDELCEGKTEEEIQDWKEDEDSTYSKYLKLLADAQEELAGRDSESLSGSYRSAYEKYQTYQEKYSDRLADFNEEYDVEYGDDDELEDKIEKLEDTVSDYADALEQAKLNQKTGTLSAEQIRELAELSAQTALSQYNLTKLLLNQDVDEAQEIYDQTLRQINEIQQSLSDDGIVYAPCTGMIVSISLDEGDDFDVTYDEDTDTLREQTLLTMTDISSVYVPITVSEEDILNVYIGQPSTVTMTAFEGMTFEAEVDTISVEAARSGAATVSYTVNVRYLGENELDMYEGMSAQTTLIQRTAADVLYVSNQAVTNTDGIAAVQKLGEDGNAVTARIKTGFSNGQYVEILEGLEEGDVVLAESGVSRQ
ncbi:efflux RND transporter periplasmic adaptor subunit [Yanshouia hominis]|uniref:Efflux RND transporter periplasmic adaptor subunit n=1 Tax=Yanshouia hominis TaxID=2763673 RepID=A0ABR7NKJ0_9FIRM|nr:efflux RND transporter periplasmic adaptor subunit [Yanshouia hominis]MBC8576921.1 efflux RND transporter periplasmic adaptor subunit [Yanshouia hominis]